MLYKYREVNDWLQQILAENTLHFGSPLKFNDPFDGQLQFQTNNTLPELTRFLSANKPPEIAPNRSAVRRRAKEFVKKPHVMTAMLREGIRREMDGTGVCCFSQCWDSILQWAYYSQGHQGVVLGFDVTSDPLFFIAPIKVEYVVEYPTLNFLKNREACIKALITNKAKVWEHEAELRVYKKPKGNYAFSKEALTEVTFGVNCSYESERRVRLWCEQGGLHSVRFFKATRAKYDFALERNELR